MSKIPDDLLQTVMQMTGMSRKEAEKELTKSMSEMLNGNIFKAQAPQKKGKRGAKHVKCPMIMNATPSANI